MKIQPTKDYLLIVDGEADKKQMRKWYWDTKYKELCFQQLSMPEHNYLYYALIIAYYPLTSEARELPLPRLPEWRDDIDTVGKCANCGVEFHIHKPEQAKRFTAEDMNKAMIKDVINNWQEFSLLKTKKWVESYTQSIHNPQYPKEFIPEELYGNDAIVSLGLNGHWYKTTINSEGKEVLVGKYLY